MFKPFRWNHLHAILIVFLAFLSLGVTINGCDSSSSGGGCDDGNIEPNPTPTPPPNGNGDNCQVTAVPAAERQRLNLNTFYQKYASANGIPIVTSVNPDDEALTRACELVIEMTKERPDVRQALITNKVHFTIIGINEQTTDIPEYSYLPAYYNVRARGLGGNPGACSEENILCQRGDRWAGESICVHEFAHTIAVYGLYYADQTFESRLNSLYNAAKASGTYDNTYAMDQPQEYWAEGVQNWYNTNLESIPANGVHNFMNTQEELLKYDPNLYKLIDELLPQDTKWFNCYEK